MKLRAVLSYVEEGEQQVFELKRNKIKDWEAAEEAISKKVVALVDKDCLVTLSINITFAPDGK